MKALLSVETLAVVVSHPRRLEYSTLILFILTDEAARVFSELTIEF